MPGKLLQIAQLGNPILSTRAREVNNVKDPEVQQLIDDMLATCEYADGVGIAAPQVYQSLRIFIMASKPNPRYPNAPTMEPLVLINPELITYVNERIAGWEGCLSIPGLRGLVPRYPSVDVQFLDRDGTKQKRTFDEFLARIFQHEFDHINGILFIGRVSVGNLMMESEFQKRIKPS